MRSYDLLIVGSGPAGMQAAIRTRQAGRRVAVIEKRTLVGGSCIHSGTIPSKTLRQAVIDLSGFRQWGLYSRGPTRRPRLPLGDLRDRFQRVISQEVKFQDRLLESRQIDAIYGDGDGTWEIVDYKSGRYRDDPARKVQLEAYAIAAAGGAVSPMTPDAIDVTFAYFGADKLVEVTESVDNEWLTEARNHVAMLVDQGINGPFEPSPSDDCRWCDFLHLCPAGRAHLAE